MPRILVVLALTLALASQALAAEKRIVFINSVDQQIKQIRLAPAGSGKWGPNLLDKWKLKEGKRVNIAVPHDEGDCMWDLKYVVREKMAYTIKDVDICKAVEINLFLKNGEAWANIK
ncbi:hypothetical protein [Fundidesulfovibrio terrae]|uniref:hypothetical protein n=1 Tax=Fundidesulfovibrio terrae TaxID=2922866 RepID=UPI001FAF7748|nr:hypothetical protein [Fundidesulfovibrio terrae]